MSLMHILLNSIDADMKSEIGSSRGGLRPYPLRFHVREAGADAKLIQHGPLGVAYHRRHPISTVLVARITAHAMVPGALKLKYGYQCFAVVSLENCARASVSRLDERDRTRVVGHRRPVERHDRLLVLRAAEESSHCVIQLKGLN